MPRSLRHTGAVPASNAAPDTSSQKVLAAAHRGCMDHRDRSTRVGSQLHRAERAAAAPASIRGGHSGLIKPFDRGSRGVEVAI